MIIVVDDHEDTCEMLVRLLRVAGLASRYFTDAHEAFEELHGLDPQCVILDPNMPGMTGLDFLRSIRLDDRFNHLPVIIYSSEEHDDRQEEAKMLGAAAWIVKGTAFSILLDQVADLAK